MQSFKVSTLVLVAALAACASEPSPRIVSEPRAPVGAKPVHGKIVATEEGPFQFGDVSITRDYTGARLMGKVTNNTSKHWDLADFEVVLMDASGNKVGSEGFRIMDIAPGQTKAIGILEGYGESIRVKDFKQVSTFDFKFSNGSIPATYVFALSKPVGTGDLSFSDDAITIQFNPTKKQIGFVVRNKSSSPAKIDWNLAAYVDADGASHKVMHEGVKFTDRSNVQPPTVIPPGASAGDLVYPIDYAVYISGRYGGWTELPLFPEAPKAKAYKGKTFGVFLPLEIDGRVRNYNFVFTIKDVTT
jgi:hypothetical protein